MHRATQAPRRAREAAPAEKCHLAFDDNPSVTLSARTRISTFSTASSTDASPFFLTLLNREPVCRARRNRALHRHRPLLMGPALDGGGLAVARDHAHAFVDPRDDVVRRAGLQEGDAVPAACGKNAVTR